jgi:retron-type reverse transcriptase
VLSGKFSPERIRDMDKCYIVPLTPQVAAQTNMRLAAEHVIRNGGSPGIDGMTVEELLPYQEKHGDELAGRICNGKYWPKPVRRVEIPKPGRGAYAC